MRRARFGLSHQARQRPAVHGAELAEHRRRRAELRPFDPGERRPADPGALGQNLQGAGRETVEHLYVYDGDLKTQDEIQATFEQMLKEAKTASTELNKLTDGTAAAAQADTIATSVDAWGKLATEAISRSRQETVDAVEERDGSRNLYVEEISGETNTLARDVVALQAAVSKGTEATADDVAARAGSMSKMLRVERKAM